jgi:hypothetical protein
MPRSYGSDDRQVGTVHPSRARLLLDLTPIDTNEKRLLRCGKQRPAGEDSHAPPIYQRHLRRARTRAFLGKTQSGTGTAFTTSAGTAGRRGPGAHQPSRPPLAPRRASLDVTWERPKWNPRSAPACASCAALRAYACRERCGRESTPGSHMAGSDRRPAGGVLRAYARRDQNFIYLKFKKYSSILKLLSTKILNYLQAKISGLNDNI